MRIYFFLLFCFSLFFLYAEKPIHGRHYVHKPDFLELKSERDMNSKTIAKIPYGARVDIEKEASSVAYNDNFLKGNIRYVSYKKLAGYIFDGYVSRYPTPLNRCESLKNYADESFKRLNSQVQNDSQFKGIITNYIGGIKHIFGKTTEERVEQLFLSNAKFKDAYFIARVCAHPSFHGIAYPENEKEISETMQDMKGNTWDLIIREENAGAIIIQTNSSSKK